MQAEGASKRRGILCEIAGCAGGQAMRFVGPAFFAVLIRTVRIVGLRSGRAGNRVRSRPK